MRFNSVSQWLAWQETLNPREIELGLERVAQVHARLGLAQFTPVIISVAGTNGKGSCVALLSAILTAAGYRVGAYTSPHLLRYNERIRLNDIDVNDDALCRAFQAVDDARGDTPLTYFEFGTLAALQIFAKAEVEVMILEVGLGGRLDAVNIVDADVALISSIGIDHTDWLGPDRESIGQEKAGILRPNKPLVCGDARPPASVFNIADSLHSPVDLVQRDFTYQHDKDSWSWTGHALHYQSLPLPALAGEQQLQNAACVLAVLERLQTQLPVSEIHIHEGLRFAWLAGRLQIVGRAPLQVLDVAHNPQAAEALAQALPQLRKKQLLNRQPGGKGKIHAVFSALVDKDIAGVVAALAPLVDDWHVAPLAVPRSATVEQIRTALQMANIEAMQGYDSVTQAFNVVLSQADAQDCILVCGSFYTVAEVLLLTGA
jgi:dihydrofolate synthase/folylpolyglutamate synthase